MTQLLIDRAVLEQLVDCPASDYERMYALKKQLRAALAGAETAGWIRVGDRLPQEEERVLIFTHGHPSISVLYKGEFIMPSAVQPTHWMPLPTPPKDTL